VDDGKKVVCLSADAMCGLCAVGSVVATGVNMQLHCTVPANVTSASSPAILTPPSIVNSSISEGSESSSSSSSASAIESSSGGTPAWVWAVVGTVAALAVVAVAGGLVWRRRRKRTRQQQGQVLKLEGQNSCTGHLSDELSGQASLASAKLSSLGKAQSLQPELSPAASADPMQTLGSGSSALMEQLVGSRSGVPEGPWKSRWVGMVESVQLNLLLPAVDVLWHWTGCCCTNPTVCLHAFAACRVGFIEGLQLGGLIGRGGYARVYKGATTAFLLRVCSDWMHTCLNNKQHPWLECFVLVGLCLFG
jgi:hypothetical protein